MTLTRTTVKFVCMIFSALRAGLEVEWATLEKPLRKAAKKYCRRISDDDHEAKIAEDESVGRFISFVWFMSWYLMQIRIHFLYSFSMEMIL